jgi:DNA-binding SARP family transcriptional activator
VTSPSPVRRIRFDVLGSTEVVVDGLTTPIPAAQQRIIVAGLLLNSNRVVSVDRIASFLWGEELPPSAVATIRTYVMRLRRALGPASERLVTKAPGYLVAVDDDESDLASFFALRDRAGRLISEGRLEDAAGALARALGLWRDSPLLDVPSPTLQELEVPPLLEMRMQTLETWIDLELQLGRHAPLVPELSRLVRANPRRESFSARLMLALHGSGRRSDALDVFLRTRSVLVEQLGSEPSQELRDVQRLVLAADQDRPDRGVPVAPRPVTPANLADRWRLIGAAGAAW